MNEDPELEQLRKTCHALIERCAVLTVQNAELIASQRANMDYCYNTGTSRERIAIARADKMKVKHKEHMEIIENYKLALARACRKTVEAREGLYEIDGDN